MFVQRFSRLALIATTLFGSLFVFLPVSATTISAHMVPPVNMQDAVMTQAFSWHHTGVDIAPYIGGTHLPVVAAADGVVTVAASCENQGIDCNGGYGDQVVIAHAGGMQTRYAHLSRLDVKVGDHVKMGQQLGLMGNTGRVFGATGVHLHFEVYAASHGHESGVRINPRKVVPGLGRLGYQWRM